MLQGLGITFSPQEVVGGVNIIGAASATAPESFITAWAKPNNINLDL